jgi:FkbM family methyltransferase
MSVFSTYIRPFFEHPLNRSHKIAAAFRFIKWQMLLRHANASGAHLVAPYLGNLKLLVKKGQTGITGNLYSGLQEFEEMGFVIHFLRENDLFFDIGANAGIYTILASGIKKAHSHSFEPIPGTFHFLKNNIAINNLEARTTLYNMGVGRDEGYLSFSADRDVMNKVVAEGYSGAVEKVRVISFDHMFSGMVNKPAMIKIDTEGFEDQVILGAVNVLRNENVKVVLLEMNKPEVIHHLLTEIGFQPYSYDVFKRELTEARYDVAANLIYIRDREFVKQRISTSEKITIHGKNI